MVMVSGRGLVSLALVAIAPGVSTAQQAQSDITIASVQDGLFVIAGAGGNIAVRVTPDGVVLVDAGAPGRFAEVERLVASVTSQPIRYVVDTHFHPDHAGGNAAAGADVEIVAHAVTPDLMERNGMPGAPRTVFADGITLSVGDVEVRVLHLGAGHTGGDAVVYFRISAPCT